MQPVEFFNKIFESREKSQIFHWMIKSHETHIAMEAYYTDVIEHLDTMIESYQGKYNILDGYMIMTENKETDPIKYFEEYVQFLEKERTCIKQNDTFLHNQIDEIITITYKTLFKLKNLQ